MKVIVRSYHSKCLLQLIEVKAIILNMFITSVTGQNLGDGDKGVAVRSYKVREMDQQRLRTVKVRILLRTFTSL